MQSGSINNNGPHHVGTHRAPQAKGSTETAAQEAAAKKESQNGSPTGEISEPSEVFESARTMPLGFVVNVAPEALRTRDDGKGGYETEMTLAFVKKEDQQRLQAEGALFPEMEQALLGDAIGPEGELKVVPLYDTNNSETIQFPHIFEVNKKSIGINPETGMEAILGATPTLLADGEGVLPAGHMAVPTGSSVIPKGYAAELAGTEASNKIESHRVLMNNITKGLGTFSGSSLAGVMRLPVISTFAPILALGSAGFVFNQSMEQKRDLTKQLGYLEEQKKNSETDLVKMKTVSGEEFGVSAKNEKIRLDTQVRQANLQLASTGLLAASGGSSIIGSMATAGVGGLAGLAGAAAVAPWLAGGALVLGNGGMVFNSLSQLKELSKERTELLAAQEKGETHVDRVLEGMNAQLGRATSVGEEMVSIPIAERLKDVEKEQRKQRLMATLYSGAGVSLANLMVGLGAAGAVGAVAMAPAAGVAAYQSVGQLRELSKERKDLQGLAEKGETMVERQLQQGDGNYATARVPISTLLNENKKSANKHKMILTAVGSVGAGFGLTMGLGLSVAAVAPLALVPLAIGVALFPDKARAFADKVTGLVSGTFGEAGRSAREVKRSAEGEVSKFTAKLDEQLSGLQQSHPDLFADRPGRMPLTKTKYGGYYTEMKSLAMDYATAKTPVERQAYLATIKEAMANAPDSAKPGLAAYQEGLDQLSMEVEAQWLARDINLEMKTKTTDQVVNDDRVKARLSELEFPLDTVREQYQESLFIENTPTEYGKLAQASQAGDVDATRVLARTKIFGAARLLATQEKELGTTLLTRYMDAIEQPKNEENLELLIKEVGYRQGVAVSSADVEQMSVAMKILETPYQPAFESGSVGEPRKTSDSQAMPLSGPEARMTQAFRALDAKQPKLARDLQDAFLQLNNPSNFEGMSAVQEKEAKIGLNQNLVKVRDKVAEKEPELLKLWDKARLDLDKAYFERSIDHDFKDRVLSSEAVVQAAEQFGVGGNEVDGLYMDLLRSQILGDPAPLQERMKDESGTEIDADKVELITVLDRAMLREAAAVTGGGADFRPASPNDAPHNDPSVANFLHQRPEVVQALNSSQFQELAQNLQMKPEEVQNAYLEIVKVELNPTELADFNGRLEAGDVAAVKTLEVGRAVAQFVAQITRPDPEMVKEQLEASMQGAVIQQVLSLPEITEAAENLQVDAQQSMRMLIQAELSSDPSALAALEEQAQKGDAAAGKQLQMLQALSQAVQYFANQAQAQVQQGTAPFDPQTAA